MGYEFCKPDVVFRINNNLVPGLLHPTTFWCLVGQTSTTLHMTRSSLEWLYSIRLVGFGTNALLTSCYLSYIPPDGGSNYVAQQLIKKNL
jgi:hypothetical protein